MKLFPSLFWRLYLSIIGALLLVGAFFIATTIYFERLTSVDHFYGDVSGVSYPVLEQWQSKQSVDAEFLQALEREHFFNLQIIDTSEKNEVTRGYDFIRIRDDVQIFEDEHGLMALQPLFASGMWLVISDVDAEDIELSELPEDMLTEIERQAEEEATSIRIFQFTLGGMLLFVAVVLLFQVRKISGHIDRFIEISIKWGLGDLKKQANENAPYPLDSLAKSLNEMASKLHQFTQEQQVMVHAVSHELRTPLSKLELALSILQQKHNIPRNEPLIENLSTYMDELSGLANQVLTYSKLRHRKTGFAHDLIDFSLLVTDRAEQLGALYESKIITFNVQNGLTVSGEAFYLQMLLDNIISNALKYSKSDVSVDLEENESDVYLQVSDNGPGIPVNHREQVFLPFFRVDESRTKDTGGFGLGLALVETIIQQHEGSIELGDRVGGGLRVTVRLPRAGVLSS